MGNKSASSNMPKYFVLGFFAVGAFIIFNQLTNGGDDNTQTVSVKLPQLTAAQLEGKKLFDANCAACHGKNAAGSGQGPTFISPIYRPNHHADQAFVIAAMQGVRAHHWQFGNMPPQPQVKPNEVLKIVNYVRALQRANGIN